MSERPLGILPEYPIAMYHADPAIGGHAIGKLAESGARFHFGRQFESDPNDAMKFGTAFHMRVLQPWLFCEYVVPFDETMPKRGSKARTEFEREWERERGLPFDELIFLDENERKKLDIMASGIDILNDEAGFEVFGGEGPTECPHFWEELDFDGEVRVRGKALPDKLHPEMQVIVDVKTTRIDLDPKSLARYAAEFNWATQGAWYMRGMAETRGWTDQIFAFAVFQTVPPFAVRWCPMPPETLEIANRLVERGLANLDQLNADLRDGRRLRDAQSGTSELRYPDWFLQNIGLS